MHKGRITVAIIAAVGIIAAFLPWFEFTPDLSKFGFNIEMGPTTSSGVSGFAGIISIVFFLVIAAFALIGKKEKMIAKGFPKMGILIMSGLILLGTIIVLTVCMVSSELVAKMGVYITMILSLVTAIAPYVFKADGTVHVPEIEDVMDDIEDSAEIVEDKVEDIADKVEDKFEDTFDKDDDDDDKDEKKEEKKEEPKEESSDDKPADA